ncbi:MAG: glycoside hydrolase family 16 protein [Labilithrix sp.]|nr:glycoside hydrolase family 16 protein [Labilithrix sp.]MCW5812405.1 glycoside hydrolase family 16 protein [Labilithrix sp.]
MRRALGLLFLAFLGCLLGCDADAETEHGSQAVELAAARTIRFSGHDWIVKDGDGFGPGPNRWRADNVFVDDAGALHLRVARDASGRWSCAEIRSVEPFGWGTYRFDVEGRLDELPPQAVLGLFNYPRWGTPPDATSEIDVEIAQWGDPNADRGSFTLWGGGAEPLWSERFPLTLYGTHTSHAFEWRSDVVRFASRHGHGANGVPIALREHRPVGGAGEDPRPVHLNLWLFRGEEPPSGFEVVVRRFVYAP